MQPFKHIERLTRNLHALNSMPASTSNPYLCL